MISFDRLRTELAPYVTNSGEPPEEIATDLILRSAGVTATRLAELAREILPRRHFACPMTLFADTTDSADLAVLFNRHGSDKSSAHDYHRLYGHILGTRRQEPVRVLEIGLGSNNADVVSNMGPTAKPGASLRAFRDFLPRGAIYGADVDRRILFEEERITTFFVDQNKPETFATLQRSLTELDLVVDDGLHSPDANLTVAAFAARTLRSKGWLVIEDIRESSLPIWHVAATMFRTDWTDPLIIHAQGGYVFAVQRH